MDLLGLLLGLLLLWAFGIACLAAFPGNAAWTTQPGGFAWTFGAGGLAGLFLATLWLRALSFAGIHFGVAVIAAPVAIATLALGWIVVRRRGAAESTLRDVLIALSGRSLERTSRLIWRLLLAWIALRFAMLLAEVATRPLYPWDSWTQWATKARVWYELGRIAAFARSDAWFAAGGTAYFDAGPNYPGTLGLMQVLACTFLGRWDDTLMTLPASMLTVPFAIAAFGAL